MQTPENNKPATISEQIAAAGASAAAHGAEIRDIINKPTLLERTKRAGRGVAKAALYTAGGAVIGGACFLAYRALKAGGADAVAEAVGDAATAATTAAADAVAAAFRG
ncbi:hypothetical protein D3C81_434040 [compost metagenome]